MPAGLRWNRALAAPKLQHTQCPCLHTTNRTPSTARTRPTDNIPRRAAPAVCSSGGREQPALPATAQVAFQQADYVAWNLWAAINGKPLLSFRCAAGRRRGVQLRPWRRRAHTGHRAHPCAQHAWHLAPRPPPQKKTPKTHPPALNAPIHLAAPLLRPRSYQHLGDMMSLGTTSGAVTLPIPVPPQLSAAAQSGGPLGQLLKAAGVKLSGSYGGNGGGVTLEGPLAAALRRAAYLYRQPTLEQQLRVAGGWAQQATSQLKDVLAAAAGRGASG